MNYPEEHELHAKAQEIAIALGDDWQYVTPENITWQARIIGKSADDNGNRPALFLARHGRDTRIRISGEWPDDSSGHMHKPFETPDITVAISRTPEAIAKDIQRRFLPNYLRKYQEYLERCHQADDYTRRRTENLETLAADLGVKIDQRDNGTPRTFQLYLPGDCYGTVEVFDEQTYLNIRHVSIEKTRAILRMLYDKEPEPIIVRICDGFAGSVVIPDHLKGTCKVEVRNFDTEGCADLELDELDREEGQPYFCTVWK